MHDPVNFSAVDPTLRAWASRNCLPLCTKYRDADVRSFELVGPDGRVQIWVEINGETTVHVWDHRKRKQTFSVGESTLVDGLDNALRVARTSCGTP